MLIAFLKPIHEGETYHCLTTVHLLLYENYQFKIVYLCIDC